MIPLLPLAMTAAPFVANLFGGGGEDRELKDALKGLEQQTAANRAKATQLDQEGSALLAPVKRYLGDITSGDRQAIQEATMPERRRVIDQYDTAKRAIAEFAPRGGGQAGAFAELGARQASDLAVLGSEARTRGMDSAANLAMAIRQMGLPREQLASMNMGQLIQTLLARSDQSHDTMMGLGEALGNVIGLSMNTGA